jgi:hypothetical protein
MTWILERKNHGLKHRDTPDYPVHDRRLTGTVVTTARATMKAVAVPEGHSGRSAAR